uniref:Cytochrome c peroxidase, mitochondrial n=1 Tax=Tetraselmis sp. GSL018 TaxID=582737 RepID=A0A061R9T9_9CHLO
MSGAASLLRSGTHRACILGLKPQQLAFARLMAVNSSENQATEAKSFQSGSETGQFSNRASGGGSSNSGSRLPFWGALLGAGAGLFYAKQQGMFDGLLGVPPKSAQPDYDAVRKAIADILEAEDYDDGSYGPVLVRLAWHSCGTYDKATGTGGSNGATMRFNPESEWGANAGLNVARNLLEPVKRQFPWISYSDLWTLAAVVAIEEMGGPAIPWRPGRSDATGAESCPPNENLPDGSKGAAHIRDVFYRMGFNDQEIVALSGAHTLGRCHTDRSGFANPWTRAPTTFSNLYFVELKNNRWRKKKWDGPVQYEDPSGELMMLPTDMALLWDRSFRRHVDAYAKSEERFFDDFAAAFGKLLELGVPFPEPEAA